ncbi:NAD(P)-dependent oxidoreductase [Novosphingobium sp. JCM 18896]|uniref:NAD(P)-dependent oxidoreductase n=1 Tax=Novosphingobium sp. JCM 18896 TaxID=2989731 RepID=UPI002221D57E|nr:NAD(P)-dependent oxidoreductase [Novosphingobium sp. JCM 18896]MCW1429621.1 NAD(P)-dependent oxidoreductase [Novosphingobium sp. JCM 18896]
MKIGLIGAGRMGRPILDRLREAGHDAAVLVRQAEAREDAAAAGLSAHASIAETVRDADLVFCVVLNDAQVREVCLGPDGAIAAMKPGAVLVQHTTSDPATAQLLGVAAAERGVQVLDAALSGGPHDIAAGRLTLWVGGDEAVLAAAQPALASYADPILFVGALGNGQKVKLVNNALFVSQVGLAVEAVRLAGALGIDEPAILAALQHGSGASRGLAVVASGGSVAAVAPRIGALMAKDVATVRAVAAHAGVDLGVIGEVLASDAVEKQVLGAN